MTQADERGYVGCVIAVDEVDAGLAVTLTMENRGKRPLQLPWEPALTQFSDPHFPQVVTELAPEVPEELRGAQVVTARWTFTAGPDTSDLMISWGPFSWWSLPDRSHAEAEG